MRPYPPDLQPFNQTRKSRSIVTLPFKSTLAEIKKASFPKPYPPGMLLPTIQEIMPEKQIIHIELKPRTPTKSKHNRSIKTIRSIQNIQNKERQQLHLCTFNPKNIPMGDSYLEQGDADCALKMRNSVNKTRKSIEKDIKRANEKLKDLQKTFQKKKKTYKISQSTSQKALKDIQQISNKTESLVNHIEDLEMRKSATDTMLRKGLHF
jgi:flagellar motility protein MotE (MotC chaperone)